MASKLEGAYLNSRKLWTRFLKTQRKDLNVRVLLFLNFWNLFPDQLKNHSQNLEMPPSDEDNENEGPGGTVPEPELGCCEVEEILGMGSGCLKNRQLLEK